MLPPCPHQNRPHLLRDKHLLEAHNVWVGQQAVVHNLPLHILLVKALQQGGEQGWQCGVLAGQPEGSNLGGHTQEAHCLQHNDGTRCAAAAAAAPAAGPPTGPSSMNLTATSSPVSRLRACCTQPKAPAGGAAGGGKLGRGHPRVHEHAALQPPGATTLLPGLRPQRATCSPHPPLSRSLIFSYLRQGQQRGVQPPTEQCTQGSAPRRHRSARPPRQGRPPAPLVICIAHLVLPLSGSTPWAAIEPASSASRPATNLCANLCAAATRLLRVNPALSSPSDALWIGRRTTAGHSKVARAARGAYWPGWLNRETTGAETAPADRLRGMRHLVQAGDLEGQITWRAPPPPRRPRPLALNLQNCSLERKQCVNESGHEIDARGGGGRTKKRKTGGRGSGKHPRRWQPWLGSRRAGQGRASAHHHPFMRPPPGPC